MEMNLQTTISRQFNEWIESYGRGDESVRNARDNFLSAGTEMIDERRMPQHLTASVMLIDGTRVLLMLHKKLGIWLPPGGHLNPGEHPVEAAVRELREETSLTVPVPDPESVLPFHIDVHPIPGTSTMGAHEHVDWCYLLSASQCSGAAMANLDEADDLAWTDVTAVSETNVRSRAVLRWAREYGRG